ncbi:MAG TPA: RNA methyltransferase [Panacibacter sp.]|nr:RNA methyltransferase [Panacibacter sp.]
MISKNETKYIQSLYHKKTRDEEGVFIAEGVKLVHELLESSFTIRKIYATTQWATQCHSSHPIIILEEFELEKISKLTTANQVLAIVEKRKLVREPQQKQQITIVADGIQDPGNLGTIIRIADWFGIKQIVASTDSADVYNSKTIQSTMGSIVRVDVWYKDVAKWLADCNVPVYGALLNGTSVYELPAVNEALLVIGNESKGIRANILPFIQQAVTIPKKGGAESLNAAVATGIILSHLVK